MTPQIGTMIYCDYLQKRGSLQQHNHLPWNSMAPRGGAAACAYKNSKGATPCSGVPQLLSVVQLYA